MSANEKVLAKCGRKWTESSVSTKRSRCFFNGTKLLKKCGIEKQRRQKMRKIFNSDLNPAFCQYNVVRCAFLCSQ